MFLIFSKPQVSYQQDTPSSHNRQQGSIGTSTAKNNKQIEKKDNHDRTEGLFENRTYDIIEPPEELQFSDLNVDMIEKEASIGKEHIYESIDKVYTRNTSCQTENLGGISENFKEKKHFVKVFKDISCQTELTSESRRNKKRNSESQGKDMQATVGKTKECRLSSDSSTSTQDSQDSADSGHFSVRNPEKSPQSPQEPLYLWQPEGLNNDEVRTKFKGHRND